MELTSQEHRAVALRLQNLTLAIVATALEISRQRVSQLLHQAADKMKRMPPVKAALRSWG